MTLKEKIDAIPGEDGWYKQSSGERYYCAAKELIERGLSEDDAVNFLDGLYWAAASCYGA